MTSIYLRGDQMYADATIRQKLAVFVATVNPKPTGAEWDEILEAYTERYRKEGRPAEDVASLNTHIAKVRRGDFSHKGKTE